MASINSLDIPGTWCTVQLGDVSTLVTGNTPSKKRPEYYGGSLPFVKPTQLQNAPLLNASEYLSDSGREVSRVLPKNSVLISCIGNLGRTAIAKTEVATNQQINALIPYDGISGYFLFYQMQSARFRLGLEAIASSTTIPIVNKSKLSTLQINLAPLNEQRRIVAKIEELFSELDKGVESLKTARAQLKTYRQSLLKAAFEGRLTEQWRRDNPDKLETADQLLERIREEREARYQQLMEEWKVAVAEWEAEGKLGRKPKKPTLPKWLPDFEKGELEGLEKPPKGWGWVRYGNLCEIVRNGISEAPKGATGEKIFRISAVRPMTMDMADYRYIDNSNGAYDEYFLQRGDIVFTRYNGSRNYVGVSAVFRSEEGFLYPDKLIRTRLGSREVSPDFIELASNSGDSRKFIEKKIRTTAGQSGISGTDIKMMPVPLCSHAEQTLIVEVLQQALSRVVEMEESIEDSLLRAAILRQSILKQAFEGKLVPQNPDDEPASALLDRIRQEQAVQAKPERRKSTAEASA